MSDRASELRTAIRCVVLDVLKHTILGPCPSRGKGCGGSVVLKETGLFVGGLVGAQCDQCGRDMEITEFRARERRKGSR